MRDRTPIWLRLEGLAILAVALLLYARHGEGWLLFALLFLVPDVSMIGYLRGPVTGAAVYNAVHTYTASLGLAAVGLITAHPVILSLSIIWTSHIAMDRVLGYGLKQPAGFHHTHLGRIGFEGRSHSRTLPQ